MIKTKYRKTKVMIDLILTPFIKRILCEMVFVVLLFVFNMAHNAWIIVVITLLDTSLLCDMLLKYDKYFSKYILPLIYQQEEKVQVKLSDPDESYKFSSIRKCDAYMNKLKPFLSELHFQPGNNTYYFIKEKDDGRWVLERDLIKSPR